MNSLFNQLASTSAVLGGFAFAFVGAILSGSSRNRAAELTIGFVLPSAACFVLSALGWAIISVWFASPQVQPQQSIPKFIFNLHLPLAFSFFLGVFSFSVPSGAADGCIPDDWGSSPPASLWWWELPPFL